MFAARLKADAARVETRLRAEIARYGDLPVVAAMDHACQGGKGLRGFLVMESARLHDIPEDQAILPACAIEAVHAYSLIHDDLPAMDDDDLRRGRPTVHVKWDEATAILAGDALQTLAFGLLADPALPPARAVALSHDMAQAAGAGGMVLGQALDIAAETAAAPLDLDQTTALQAGKTGALIGWAACAGAVLAGADATPLRSYAAALGLAFQIADDILDVEGCADKTGKRLRKDADAGKATFVSLLGLDGARARAAELVTQAEAALDPYADRAQVLKEAARFAIARDR
ncbi:MAG: farnesyl-diphosphate synthase [Confluentimicrobium sp.]|nr:farnesyl-diphosphate synthase [Actibacterium sp.]|tara:strand:+ start:91 stop:954 length:864 start_codon:yes stop_codon:yes gene_type:complete